MNHIQEMMHDMILDYPGETAYLKSRVKFAFFIWYFYFVSEASYIGRNKLSDFKLLTSQVARSGSGEE